MSYDTLNNFKKLFYSNKEFKEEEKIINKFKQNRCNLPMINKNGENIFLDAGAYAHIYKTKIGRVPVVVRIAPFNRKMKDENETEFLIYKMLYSKFEEFGFSHIPILYDSYKCYYNDVKDRNNVKLLKLLKKEKYYQYIYRFIIMEYLPWGNLDTYLFARRKRLDEEFFTKIYLQILIILYFLNTKVTGYFHNDLHLRNLLVRENKKKSLAYSFPEFDILIKDMKVTVLINDFDYSEFISVSNPIGNRKVISAKMPIYKEGNFVDLFKVTNYFLIYYFKYLSEELKQVMYVVVPKDLAGGKIKINDEIIIASYNILIDRNHEIFKKYFKKLPVIEHLFRMKIFENYFTFKE
jgi:hypothetical protein